MYVIAIFSRMFVVYARVLLAVTVLETSTGNDRPNIDATDTTTMIMDTKAVDRFVLIAT